MHTTSGRRVAWQSTSDGENSYSHWAAQQLRGPWQRARSRVSGCGASACSSLSPGDNHSTKVRAWRQAHDLIGACVDDEDLSPGEGDPNGTLEFDGLLMLHCI
jgi:hypothetical protein